MLQDQQAMTIKPASFATRSDTGLVILNVGLTGSARTRAV